MPMHGTPFQGWLSVQQMFFVETESSQMLLKVQEEIEAYVSRTPPQPTFRPIKGEMCLALYTGSYHVTDAAVQLPVLCM